MSSSVEESSSGNEGSPTWWSCDPSSDAGLPMDVPLLSYFNGLVLWLPETAGAGGLPVAGLDTADPLRD